MAASDDRFLPRQFTPIRERRDTPPQPLSFDHLPNAERGQSEVPVDEHIGEAGVDDVARDPDHHRRARVSDALPLLIIHGYPSSVVEFLELIGPLSDPRSYGGDPHDAFDLVIPSLPGFGFSSPLADTGWELTRTAKAWVELMHRLDYERYGAHGGDIGGGVSGDLGIHDPDRVVGAHVNTDPTALALIGGMLPDEAEDMTEAQKVRLKELRGWETDGRGYLQIQSTRPQTLAYGLNDSPALQLAWIVEKFKEWTSPAAALPEDAVDRDQLLTNVSIYWFTSTGMSAARFIYGRPMPSETGERCQRRRPGSPCSRSTTSSGASSMATDISSIGRSSRAEATSQPWKSPNCSSATSGSSSATCAEKERPRLTA